MYKKKSQIILVSEFICKSIVILVFDGNIECTGLKKHNKFLFLLTLIKSLIYRILLVANWTLCYLR